MQIFTELFVLLSTGMDLEIISVHSIPPQFRHSKLGNELSKIKDFLYNYYQRVFPQERSTAAVMRKLPELPIIYEPFPTDKDEKTETIETIIEESEEVIDHPSSRRRGSISSSGAGGGGGVSGSRQPPIVPPPPSGSSSRRASSVSTGSIAMGGGQAAGPFSSSKTTKTQTSKPRKLSFANLGKQRLKLINAYKTISERVRERPAYAGEEIDEEDEEYTQESTDDDLNLSVDSREMRNDLNLSYDSRQVRFEEEEQERDEIDRARRASEENSRRQPSPAKKPQIRTKRKTIKKKIMEKRATPETVSQQEAILDEMRRKYKAPVRKENSARRRGRLVRENVLEQNAFTYMTTRVIAFLLENGHLSDEQINNTKYLAVDRNFII